MMRAVMASLGIVRVMCGIGIAFVMRILGRIIVRNGLVNITTAMHF